MNQAPKPGTLQLLEPLFGPRLTAREPAARRAPADWQDPAAREGGLRRVGPQPRLTKREHSKKGSSTNRKL